MADQKKPTAVKNMLKEDALFSASLLVSSLTYIEVYVWLDGV